MTEVPFSVDPPARDDLAGARPGSPSPWRLPVVALRAEVVFPRGVTTVDVERPENLAALARTPEADRVVLVVPVREPGDPTTAENCCPVGTVARVMEDILRPTGAHSVTLHGLWRSPLQALTEADGFLSASALAAPARDPEPQGVEEQTERTLALVRAISALDHRYDSELASMLALNAKSPARLIDLVASTMSFGYADRTRILCEPDVPGRFAILIELLQVELVRAQVHDNLEGQVGERVRRSYLRQQLDVIRRELGDADARMIEAQGFEERSAQLPLTEAARTRLGRALTHFRRVPHSTSESRRIRAYIEWVLELPWPPLADVGGALPAGADRPGAFSHVIENLDRTHTGLKDVKQRVAEYLAVRQLGGSARGTVLCFSGPPGTGKSSMARSMAAALGREFVHIPVGGITEEGELRGFAADSDGCGAGLILQALHRTGTCNPVVLIDEIDQVQFGSGGTAGGALLEILDRERNTEFLDAYLGVPYDLSRCIFLATANSPESLSDALLDRLEVIEFGGYTDSEKLTIAREHLIARALDRAGLEPWQLKLTPAALRTLMRNYTEEAGVRHLMRLLYSIARKAAVEVVSHGRGLYVRKSALLRLVGPAMVDDDLHVRKAAIGVCNGLAWTSTGGALLPIEALLMPGAGRVILTGQLGDVLRESVQASISFVRSRLQSLGIKEDALETFDVHLHFPSAATPKDGPSAGVAIAVSLISILARKPIRHELAMTGEISLHGDVLPVGGIRDKLLAAVRSGLGAVIVPRRNNQEILRLPAEIRRKLKIHLIDHVEEAFGLALLASVRQAQGRRGPRSTGRRSARGA